MSSQSQEVSFRVRARAIDLLGRQQIAGIPTAIHELFKNAYDAFATHVEVDVFQRSKTLVIRDNGFGMTLSDVLEKWLAVGTESKAGMRVVHADWLTDRDTTPRPVLGEKGIGRLAIASIGPVVLMISRAIRGDGKHRAVACLVAWSLFEVPGINITDIKVPIRELEDGKLPDAKDLAEMVEAVRQNTLQIESRIEKASFDRCV